MNEPTKLVVKAQELIDKKEEYLTAEEVEAKIQEIRDLATSENASEEEFKSVAPLLQMLNDVLVNFGVTSEEGESDKFTNDLDEAEADDYDTEGI